MGVAINLRQDFWINRKTSKLRSRSNWRLNIRRIKITIGSIRGIIIIKLIGRTIITMINLNIY
jgi:hypothetical protein